LSILFAQGPYALSFNPSQFELSVEDGLDRAKGIEMFKEYPVDLPMYCSNAQQNTTYFGFISVQSMSVINNTTCRKNRHEGILTRSVEEFVIDTNRIFVNAQGPQEYPSIAFDGTNYLIVWADKRNDLSKFWEIYCARCSPEGVLLDSSGILVSSTKLIAEWDEPPFPNIAFDGINYFVVWQDKRTQPGFCDIIGARITQSGVVLDPEGILISSAPYTQSYPQIAFGGTNYLVVWNDWRNGNFDIYGARVNPSGIVLDPDGIAILTMAGDQGAPAVAFDGINFLVVWDDLRNGNGDIYGSRVDQSGVVLDPGGIPISITGNYQIRPKITFGGSYYLVVWFDRRNTVDFDIYGARMSPDGIVLDPNGIPISQAAKHQAFPTLSFDGTNYLVVWHDIRDYYTTFFDIYCARVDQSGNVLDPTGIAVSVERGGQGHPAVAFDGTNYLITWHDNRSMYNGDGFDIYGARVAQTGLVLDPDGILLTMEIYGQRSSSVAFDGNNFFVVWQDFRNRTRSDIYGSRISISGDVLDPMGIPISTASFLQRNPSVTFGGGNYFVAWVDGRNTFLNAIYGARIDQQGTILDPMGIPITQPAPAEITFESPVTAFDGTNYFVVWLWDNGVKSRVLGARINQSGAVLDPNGFNISFLTESHAFPALSFGGENYLVVWEYNLPSTVTNDIWGARVTQSGVVLEPGGVSLISASDIQTMPSIAFDGTNYLIVWQDKRWGVDYDIYCARVTPNLDVLDPGGIPVALQPGDQIRPKVSFNGSQFVVVWEDVNSGDLMGAKVSSDGTVGPTFPVSALQGIQYEPAICHGPEDLTFVTFTGWVPQFENYRIWGKFIGEHALWTDDPLALAYNGNRHLVREPNSERLHIVYTDRDKVIYRFSSNGGADWTSSFILGDGKFPAITLSSDNLPSVSWTDEPGGLWYRRQTAPGVWGDVYRLYYPVSPLDPFVNSPPAITIIPSNPDEVHILITRTGRIQMNGVVHTVEDCIFPITNPEMLVFELIEQGVGGMYPPLRSHPSIARSPNNLLHAVWQRADTICYATRQVGQAWNIWGDVFDPEGHQSAHPFVETYGDMVYVVWEHKQTPGAPEEVYKGRNGIYNPQPQFSWDNISQTPNTPSRYPVNASGTFTVFQDSPWPPINGPEIYYTTDGELYNLSQTIPGSFYPQSVSRFLGSRTYLYTAWLEGDASPYEIRFKKIQYIPTEVAYLTSINGYETPSPYLVARDSFISTWQIPVDVGYETITYQFPLEPGYRYKMKLVAYHESSGQWREWIKIDNKWKHLIKYNAYEPETLEFWVPLAFYEDGKIDVVFDRITGNFATAGPIYVYQYEYEEEITELASGPMGQEDNSLNNSVLTILPNPFTEKVEIKYYLPKESPRVTLKIYDITGRLIKKLYDGPAINDLSIIWRGRDESERIVANGVYFLQLQDVNANAVLCRKILKVK
jgi:hypothetical protein